MSRRESPDRGRRLFHEQIEPRPPARHLAAGRVRTQGVTVLIRVLGGVLLLSSLGLASCQAVVHAF